MKISAFLLFCCLVNIFAAPTYSQTTKISLNLKDATIEDVLNKIEDVSEFYFLYNNKLIDVTRKVNIEADKEPIKDILNDILNKDTKFIVYDRQIILTPGDVTSLAEALQQLKVTGTVTDEKGNPLPGVTVLVKGTTTGTLSDASGKYAISNALQNATLVFSFIGMATQEVPLNDRMLIDVVLKEAAIGLDEVVVVGYGTKRKGELTGAIATVKSDVFQNRPVLNTSDALVGGLPGVVITKGSGEPGANQFTFQIRGYSSINGNKPLILIDGAPGDLNSINTNDIESVSVLKDAASSIYGSRAADGVVLITTKSANKGKTTVTYTANFGVKSPEFGPMLNTLQYATMYNDALIQEGMPVIPSSTFDKIRSGAAPEIGGNWLYGADSEPGFYTDVNHKDAIFKKTMNQQSHSLSISGGGKNSSTWLSLGYNKDDGIFKYGNENSKLYNVRFKYDLDLSSRLHLNATASMDRRENQLPTDANAIYFDPSNTNGDFSGVMMAYYIMPPFLPNYTPGGNYYYYFGNYNEVQQLKEGGESHNSTTWYTGNAKLDYRILDGLTLSGQAIAQIYNANGEKDYRSFTQYHWNDTPGFERNNPNEAIFNYGKSLNMQYYGFLNYKKEFLTDHRISVMLGASNEQFHYEDLSAIGKNYPSNDLFTLNMADKSNPAFMSTTGNAYAYGLVSFFGDFSYTYKTKAFFDFIMRSDGSSKFASSKRWSQAFPSVAIGYDFAKEDFIKSLNMFDQLKLRLSWGKTGNQDINALGMYDYMPIVAVGAEGYPLGTQYANIVGAKEGVASSNRTWETIQNTNIGIDISLLHSRLSVTGDLFQKKNLNMLVGIVAPVTYGANPPSQNQGIMVTKGFEISFNWHDKINDDFNYSINLMLSDNHNKLTELKNSDSYGPGLIPFRKGYPINSFYGFQYDGIIQTQEQLDNYKKLGGVIPSRINLGDAMYKDLDGDGQLTYFGDNSKGTKGDMKYLGDTNPRYTYSSIINIGYKAFNLNIFLQGVGRRSVRYAGYAQSSAFMYYSVPPAYYKGKVWTPQNTNARYPRMVLGSTGWDDIKGYDYGIGSSNEIYNVSYLRLKTITLSYNIPPSVCKYLTLQRASVYISGGNLFTRSNGTMDGTFDPETAGIDLTSGYPNNKVYSAGLNVTF